MRGCKLHLASISIAVVLFSCGVGGTPALPTTSSPTPAAQTAPQTVTASPADSAVKGGSVPAAAELTEEFFVESPSRRDPFRSFLVPLTKQQAMAAAPQINSILDQYQIEELRLVAIISGSGPGAGAPMAMIEDPTGVGHIIHRGNYVGKGETLRRVSTGEEIQIFWKVVRIREDAIVFEREDPFSPDEATITKILPLEPKT